MRGLQVFMASPFWQVYEVLFLVWLAFSLFDAWCFVVRESSKPCSEPGFLPNDRRLARNGWENNSREMPRPPDGRAQRGGGAGDSRDPWLAS